MSAIRVLMKFYVNLIMERTFLYRKNDTEISIFSEIHFIAFELFEYFN